MGPPIDYLDKCPQSIDSYTDSEACDATMTISHSQKVITAYDRASDVKNSTAHSVNCIATLSLISVSARPAPCWCIAEIATAMILCHKHSLINPNSDEGNTEKKEAAYLVDTRFSIEEEELNGGIVLQVRYALDVEPGKQPFQT